MQRSALCRSRRQLSNEYLLAKIGVDTAENEPCKVCPLSAYRSPRWIADTVIFFEGTWDVGMGCSARGEGRQAGQTLEGSKGSFLVVSTPTATRKDGFFGVCTISAVVSQCMRCYILIGVFLSRNIH